MGLWSEIAEDWRFYRFAEHPEGAATAFFAPGFWLVAGYRFGHWAQGVGNPALGIPLRLAGRWFNFWIGAMTGADLMPGAEIGKRFHVHTFHGIVVANGTRIGDDCLINSGVCLVHSANSRGNGTPVVGDRVRLGVGAKILGGVTVGEFSIIGANAVVTRDVPACSVAVGIPATCRPVPQEYIDEYFNADYFLRKAGLLPERDRPGGARQGGNAEG